MCNDIKNNKNKGFSLVELIVVIAIMAVLTAVLAPALLSYVERSRAQKDDSAMNEVTQAVKIALADQEVYDEIIMYKEYGNVSTYADRVTDELHYEAEGDMRGLTITFEPENHVIVLENGQVNVLKEDLQKTAKLSDMSGAEGAKLGELYSVIRSTVGETIKLDSQRYYNSPYTIFIDTGTSGGNDPTAAVGIQVYGQWGGTNLTADSEPAAPQYVKTEYGAYVGKPYYDGYFNGGASEHTFTINEDGSITSYDTRDNMVVTVPKEYITWNGNEVNVQIPHYPGTTMTYYVLDDGMTIKCPAWNAATGEIMEYYYVKVNLDE